MRKLKSVIAAIVLAFAWSAAAGPVNVNTADAKTLAAELDGVGLSKAQAIVAYREQNGRFKSIAELAQVKGIGVRTLELNSDNILLTDSP